MKIRIVNHYSCCVGFHDGVPSNPFQLQPDCFDVLKLNRVEQRQLEQFEKLSCIIHAVPVDVPFFFKVSKYHGPIEGRTYRVGERDCWGHLEADGKLYIDGRLPGQHLSLSQPGFYLIETFSPNLSYFSATQNQSILTSDGVIVLEDGNFIGSKNGQIDEMTPQEVQKILSQTEVDHSPLLSWLRLKPIDRRPDLPKQGMVIFNKITKCIEYYNGKDWVAV